MSRESYETGCEMAKLALFGGRVPVPFMDREPSTMERAAPYAGAAAAALPFAGLIGQKPAIHDPLTNPDIPRARTLEELEKLVRPGDLLVSTQPGLANPFKTVQVPFGSEFYHAGAVMSPTEASGGRPRAIVENHHMYQHAKNILDEHGKPAYEGDFPAFAEGLRDEMPDVVALRPKKPMTPEQLKLYEAKLVERSHRPYSFSKDIEAGAWEYLMPKLRALRALTGRATQCEGNICSTMPAMARYEATGERVVPYKQPQNVLPVDMLRSEEFEPVAAHLSRAVERGALSPAARKLMMLGSRGAIGAGLGLGAYATVKDPTNAALPAGMVLTPMAVRKMHALLGGNARAAREAIPHVNMNIWNMWGEPEKAHIFRNLSRRTLPLAIGGGVGALLLAKHLRNKYRHKTVAERLGID